jgi:hypothetical protein
MNNLFSSTASMSYPLSESAINLPTFMPAPLLPKERMPLIVPISPTIPLLSQSSVRFTI